VTNDEEIIAAGPAGRERIYADPVREITRAGVDLPTLCEMPQR